MKRHDLKFFRHLWRKSRDAIAKQSKRILLAIKVGMNIETQKRKKHHGHQPSGNSFRSLRRAFNQGWVPPAMSEAARERMNARYGR